MEEVNEEASSSGEALPLSRSFTLRVTVASQLPRFAFPHRASRRPARPFGSLGRLRPARFPHSVLPSVGENMVKPHGKLVLVS